MRTALVTGGAGYIGSHAVLALLEAGWRVVVLDDLSTGLRTAVPPGAEFVQGDVGEVGPVGELLRDSGAEAVLHFAGSISAEESMRDPLRFFDNNTGRTCRLLQAMRSAGVARLVFSSSAAVYGAPAGARVPEDGPTEPVNAYGASKLMTEQMLRYAAAAYGLRYVALRYFNVGGADPCGRAGPRPGRGTSLLDVALDAAAGLREAVPVFGAHHPTADGTCVRDYIHVSDLAEAHLAALAAVDGPRRVFNVGYGRGASVLQVLSAVEAVTGQRLARRPAPARAGDPPSVVADNRLLLAETAWRPRRDSLPEIINDAWNHRRCPASLAAPQAEAAAGTLPA